MTVTLTPRSSSGRSLPFIISMLSSSESRFLGNTKPLSTEVSSAPFSPNTSILTILYPKSNSINPLFVNNYPPPMEIPYSGTAKRRRKMTQTKNAGGHSAGRNLLTAHRHMSYAYRKKRTRVHKEQHLSEYSCLYYTINHYHKSRHNGDFLRNRQKNFCFFG